MSDYVEFSQLGKTYSSPKGDARSLCRISSHIPKGEFVSIIGPQRLREEHGALHGRG